MASGQRIPAWGYGALLIIVGLIGTFGGFANGDAMFGVVFIIAGAITMFLCSEASPIHLTQSPFLNTCIITVIIFVLCAIFGLF